MKLSKGFTLIEVLLVIAILGILAVLITNNFFSSLRKGRDAARKSNLSSISKAVEMFYEDKAMYPDYNILEYSKLCETEADSADESECRKTYIFEIPIDPISGNNYVYQTDALGTYYSLYSCIENSQDSSAGVDQNGYTGISCGNCGLCKYRIQSPNALE